MLGGQLKAIRALDPITPVMVIVKSPLGVFTRMTSPIFRVRTNPNPSPVFGFITYLY
jgi:hypothetical protein